MLNKTNFKIIKGNIIFTAEPKNFTIYESGYILIENGKIINIYSELPSEYKTEDIIDYGNKLIIPGMNDLHCHAPQYKNLGIAMDKELMPWLYNYTFPEESKFQNLDYAKKMYERFIHDIWKNGTTRIALFATLHNEATMLLMDMFIKAGLGAYVGKVNMDLNCPENLCETYANSLDETEKFINKYINKSELVKPIITPRFIPSCSSSLLEGLSILCRKYNLPVQSHLSENLDEIELVRKMYPDVDNYGSAYAKFNLFGETPTLMAHCIHSSKEEIDLMSHNGVVAVHCPTSNFNVGSGMMPIRTFLDNNVKVALGTDISAGHSCSLFKTMVYAIQVSKMHWVDSNKTLKFLSTSEAFYLATKAGGSFFGKVGSFEKGYDFDALVIDDSNLYPEDYTLEERIERFINIGDDRNILQRYVHGNLIPEPVFK